MNTDAILHINSGTTAYPAKFYNSDQFEGAKFYNTNATDLQRHSFGSFQREFERLIYPAIIYKRLLDETSINSGYPEDRWMRDYQIPIVQGVGNADFNEAPGQNISRINMSVDSRRMPFYWISSSFRISEQDVGLWNTAYGIQLYQELAEFTYLTMEKAVDEALMFGKADIPQVQGLFNYRGVTPSVQEVTSTDDAEKGIEIANILAAEIAKMYTESNTVHVPSHIYCSTYVYNLLLQPRYLSNVSGLSTGSSLDYLLNNNLTRGALQGKELKIELVKQLDLFGNAPYGRILLIDKNDPTNLQVRMPINQELQQSVYDPVRYGYDVVCRTKLSPLYLKRLGALRYVDLTSGVQG